MGTSVGNKKGFVSEINVTPFVDVMLVLLIIFMVAAPLMTEGLDVDLPETRAVKSLPTDSEHMILTVTPDGRLFLDDREVGGDTLEDVLKQTIVAQKKELFLQADKSVPYGVVVDVMGKARNAGIEKLGIVAKAPANDATSPKSQQGTPRSK